MARTSRKNNLTETVTSKLSAKYTVGAYIRISKEDNERDSSVSNQESMIRDFLSNRPEMLLFRTYIDNGVSSFKPARKAFDELITDVDAGKVNCVITKDLSRFGRDYIESGDYIENVFPSKGTRFIAIGDNYDSFNIKSSNETLSMAIKSVVNMQYSKDISVKVKSVITTKMKLGNYIPAALPYGYKKQYENKVFTYVVDAETADNVNKIFELACDGAQCFDIASALNEAGILSPSAYKHSKGIQNNPGANGWSKYAVERILKNRAYLGEMICNRTSNSLVSRNVKRLDESNWIVLETITSRSVTQKHSARLRRFS